MKYKVGDLVTTRLHLYLVVDIKQDKYYVRAITRDHVTWWGIYDADNDRNIKKVN